jgi:hypothetical protein
MKRHFAIKAIALAVTGASSAAWGQTMYTIKDIAPPVPAALQGKDATFGEPIEASSIVYANSSGIVIGSTTEYPQQAPYSGAGVASFYWYYNTSSGASTATPIGLTSAQYQRSTDSNYLNMGTAVSYNNSRIYQNGYTVGFSARYDDSGTSTAGTSLGSDVWIFNGSTTSEVPLPAVVPVPVAYAANAANIAYSYATATAGQTYEAMGGNSNTEMAGANGSAAGTVTLYYNIGTALAPSWTSGGTDAFYYNGLTTTTIGLVDGNNLRTTGYTNGELFGRTNTIVRDNASGEVLGTANYYGGATTSSNTGTDIWLYNPANPTGTGAGGTSLIAPPATIAGDIYTGGGSTIFGTAAYLTDSGIVAGTWQQFATSDTARAYVQSSDAYLYNSGTNAWTGPLGLTGSAYTYYPGTAAVKAGVGGSTIPNVTVNNFVGTTESGMTVGYTTRTNPGATGVGTSAGTDAWVYYPAGNVPAGATAGVTQVGLTGGAYEANPGGTGITNNTRLTSVYAMTSGGQVTGASRRYLSSTSTTSEGADAWDYDPAHGVTTTTLLGFTGPNYEVAVPGGTNNYRNSAVTAMNNNGLVGGYTSRLPTYTTFVTSHGQDAWVFDPAVGANGTLFNVDPNDTYAAGSTFASQIGYISDTGVAIGWDSTSQTGGQSNPAFYKLFEWYLGYDSSDGLDDTPTFTYLDTTVVPSSYTGWAELYSSVGYAPSLTASGDIVGYGGLTADYNPVTGTNTNNSDVPFVLTPVGVPEPTTLALLAPVAIFLGRRRKAR